MSQFKINYRRVLDWMTPSILNQPVLMSILKSCIIPIRRMYGQFHKERDKGNYKLLHGQHVAHLEGVLNDRFDPGMRRIKIDDSPLDYEPIEFFKEAESKPVYMYRASESKPQFVWTEEETMFGGIDFVVNVPVSIPYNHAEMIALINDYKTPGMGCIIQDV